MTDTVGTRTAIEQTVRIDAPPEIVWSFWTEPARLCAWWGVAAEVELQPGGPFRVEMEAGEIMLGEFTEIDPPHRLAFTFGWEGNAPGALEPGSSVVEVTLTPDGDATVVLLRHSDVPTTHAEDHGNGWAHYVGVLLPAADRVGVTVDVTTEIDIDRPVDAVAQYVADPDNAPAWYVNIESVEWKTPPPVRVGSEVAFVARFLRRRLAYTYEFVALEPSQRLVMRTPEGPFPMETTYVWAPGRNGGTHMTLRNRGEPAGFSRLAAPFMASAMRRANRKDLAQLKALLESR